MPTDGGIGVVAQSLGVGHGEQKQIQGPGAVVGTGKILMADQPMVHPTEARGNVAQPLRPQQMLVDHDTDGQWFALFPGPQSPECSVLEVAVGGRLLRSPLVTYCR